MSHIGNIKLMTGPSGRDTDSSPNTPNPPPPTINAGLRLIGYQVTFSTIEGLQQKFIRAAGDSLQVREQILASIKDDYQKQFSDNKEVFIRNAACDKCGESPLVRGSCHEKFANRETKEIWRKLDTYTKDIVDNANPLDITQKLVFFIKKQFEALENAYRLDDVARECSGPASTSGNDALAEEED